MKLLQFFFLFVEQSQDKNNNTFPQPDQIQTVGYAQPDNIENTIINNPKLQTPNSPSQLQIESTFSQPDHIPTLQAAGSA